MNYSNINKSLSKLSIQQKEYVLNNLKQLIFDDKNNHLAKTEEYKRCSCPKCDSVKAIKYGYNKSLEQRYKCKDCKAIFSDSTGSSIFKIQHKDKWYQYIELMFDGNFYSIRKIAKLVEINTKTAFFWRHKFYLVCLKKV